MLHLALLSLVVLQARAPSPPPELLKRLSGEDVLRDFALADGSARVITLTPRGVLTAWNLADGSVAWRYEELGLKWVAACEKTLLCGMVMHAVTEIDPESGAKRSAIGGPLTEGDVDAFAADPRGRWVWLGMEQGLMRLTPGNVQGWSRRKLEGGGVTALAMDADGDLLGAGCRDGSVRFANAKSANVDDKKVCAGTGGAITALAFGSKVLVSAAVDGSVRVWGLSGKEKLVLAKSGPVVNVLAVHAKAGWVASGDAQGGLVVRDLEKGTELGRWTAEGGAAIADLEFAEKGKVLFAAAGKEVHTLDLSAFE